MTKPSKETKKKIKAGVARSNARNAKAPASLELLAIFYKVASEIKQTQDALIGLQQHEHKLQQDMRTITQKIEKGK